MVERALSAGTGLESRMPSGLRMMSAKARRSTWALSFPVSSFWRKRWVLVKNAPLLVPSGRTKGGISAAGVAGVALAGETLQAPAGGLGLEEVDGVEGLVGMDDVEVAVVVEVDEAGGGSVWREVGGPAEAMFFPGAGAERVEG